MKRLIAALSVLIVLTMLAGCGTVQGNDSTSHYDSGSSLENAVAPYDPVRDAKNECYTKSKKLLPDGAIIHDFIVDSQELSDDIDMDGFTVLRDGTPDLMVRCGTDDVSDTLDGNNCYIDFLYDNKDGYIVAYKFSWKEGYGETVQDHQEPPSTMPIPMGRDAAAIQAYLGTFSNDHMELKDRQDVVMEDAVRMETGLWSLSEAGWSLWNQFVEKAKAGEEAAIVIVRLTVEGDAIPTYLHFDGADYYIMEDTTRDAFGVGGYQEYRFSALEQTYFDYGHIIGDHYEKVTTLNASLTGPIEAPEAAGDYPILYAPERSEDMGIRALQEPTRDESAIQEYLDSFPATLDGLCDMSGVYLKTEGAASESSQGEWDIFELCCNDETFYDPIALTVVDSQNGTVSYVTYDGTDYLLVTRTAAGEYESRILDTFQMMQQALDI